MASEFKYLHYTEEVLSSNPLKVTGICDASKSWEQNCCSFKLGSKLKKSTARLINNDRAAIKKSHQFIKQYESNVTFQFKNESMAKTKRYRESSYFN